MRVLDLAPTLQPKRKASYNAPVSDSKPSSVCGSWWPPSCRASSCRAPWRPRCRPAAPSLSGRPGRSPGAAWSPSTQPEIHRNVWRHLARTSRGGLFLRLGYGDIGLSSISASWVCLLRRLRHGSISEMDMWVYFWDLSVGLFLRQGYGSETKWVLLRQRYGSISETQL